MNVYLIRHAHAGDRGDGARDIYRPLSPQGQRRAEELAGMLANEPITRIVSSPATRCTQTVEPLARALGLAVEEADQLWEGTARSQVADLLAGHHQGDLVACSHGDIIPELVEWLAAEGAAITGRGCEKGSIWVLQREQGQWARARYVGTKATQLA